MTSLAPLDDPHYVPAHPPVNGEIPDVVRKWGKASQLRWFRRFAADLNWPRKDVGDMWVSSEHHLGPCCSSCYSEYLDGYLGGGVMMDGWCCCRDEREQTQAVRDWTARPV